MVSPNSLSDIGYSFGALKKQPHDIDKVVFQNSHSVNDNTSTVTKDPGDINSLVSVINELH